MRESIQIAVLGGSGYVAGELLRLIAGHPRLVAGLVGSTGSPGAKVGSAFGHLAGLEIADQLFCSFDDVAEAVGRGEVAGVFTATPHGATATLVDRLLTAAESAGRDLAVVDLSADFRFGDPARFEAIYGQPHGAPARCARFVCAVPEHHRGGPPRAAAQPGCFTTAAVIAAHPVLAAGIVEPDVFVSAVTGSSGGGRTLSATAHHPERRSNLFAYSPLAHRHEQEMRMLLGTACGGAEPEVAFVPHSGPFVRGIHATLRFTLTSSCSAAEIVDIINRAYDGSPFVSAAAEQPRLASVIGTNRAAIGVTVRGRTLVLTSVIDNLVKGAAGGGVQWMNRLCGLPDETGLRLPGLGWF
jgi:N-acetyl-gamma-glutamyl-phosphate reductase